jgi:hypothetical protein
MASGYFTGTTGNRYITARIEWSSAPNTTNNQSSVTAILSYKKSSSSTGATYGTGSFSITINGSTKSFNVPITLNPNDTWVTIGSHTVTVDHNNDGSKSVQISATGGISGLTFSSTNCSATVILDKIPRASIPAFIAAEFTLGGNMGIVLYPADPTFRHTVSYNWGARSGVIGTNIASETTWAIPLDFAFDIPNGTQGTMFITVETFTSSGVSLGKVTRSTPCNVPASIVPTIDAITIGDTGGHVPSSWGIYVRGKSRLHVNVAASGRYYSRIVGYSIKALGVTVTSNDVDVGIISDSGTVSIEVTVTDSRGRTATKTTSISVENYAEPVIEAFSVERANSSGVAVDNGTYAKIPLKVSASSVGGKNTVEAKIYHMRSDATEWTLARTIPVQYSIDQTVIIAEMVASRSYTIKVEVVDAFRTTVSEAKLNAEGAVIGWMPGGIGISFGKAAEEQYSADFDWKIHGRKGAKFDDTVDVPNLAVNGAPTIQTVDIVTIGRDSNLEITQPNAYVGVAMNQLMYTATGKLQISGGGVVIPDDVMSVKVSAQVGAQAATPGARFLHVQIVRGDTYITVSRTVKNFTASTIPESVVISPIYLSSVKAGDIIILGMYGQTGDIVYSTNYETFMTIEAYA